LIDLEIGSHVGGIGYHYVEKPNGSYSEYIFLQGDGTNEVRIYKYVYMNPSESDYLDYEKSYTTSHTASVISNSHNYLWVVKYVGEETTNKTKSMTGFKIITNEDYSDVFLVKKYEIEQPKGCIQGVYCDSDPEIEDRLKFYFAASCNISYVYQAILTTRDFNNNNIIYGTNEYYWESYYTPYGYNSGIGKKLPDGGEGITMKDDKLWMLNEGATDYYCGDPTWDEDDIDCAREILIIDPVNFSGTHYEIFPSGSIEIFGNNLEDYGHKVAIVFAQNKQGKFYYSIGEFACETGHCEMFALTPMVPNPVGRQYNYLWFPHSYKPVVYIEDIIGIYFMNLNEEGSNGNSDDFNMSNIKFTFDDNYYLQGDNDLYSFSKQISTEFGDNSGDKDVMEFYFQFKYTGWDEGVKNFTTDMDSDVFINLRNCYDSSTSNSVCRSNALDNMEDYLDDMGGLFFYYRINYNISRLYNVER
jgi:hypothetical protein